MRTKASIVVMSHLSDIQEDNGGYCNVRFKINFVKYIILQCDGDLNIEIDADKMWQKFMEYNANLNLPEIPPAEIKDFITAEMKREIAKLLNKRERLEAIKFLYDEAKKQGKRISLKNGKNYIDENINQFDV